MSCSWKPGERSDLRGGLHPEEVWPSGHASCFCLRIWKPTHEAGSAPGFQSLLTSRLLWAREPRGDVILILLWPSTMGPSSLEEPGRRTVLGYWGLCAPRDPQRPRGLQVRASRLQRCRLVRFSSPASLSIAGRGAAPSSCVGFLP